MHADPRGDLHPDAREAIDRMAGAPRTSQLPLEDARERRRDAIRGAEWLADPEPVGETKEFPVPGPNGKIPVRVYVPRGEGPFPVFLWLHGGGWVVGGLDGADRTCRRLTRSVGCTTVSVDYRLAPEHPFPAPLQDCRAALEWVTDAPNVVRGDLDRLVVGGASAGGNLAAALALHVRDQGGPSIHRQVLLNGVFDHAFDTDSYEENGEEYGLTRADMEFYWSQYLRDEFDSRNPYASPLAARSLADLPPATVLTTGFDPLRDEGIAYAERLEDAGVPVDHRHDPDMPHHVTVFFRQGVDAAAAVLDDVFEAVDAAVD